MFMVTVHDVDEAFGENDAHVLFDSKVLADRFVEMVENELFSTGSYTASVESMGEPVRLDAEVTKLYDEMFAPVNDLGEVALTLAQANADCTCSHPRGSHEDAGEGQWSNGHCGECACDQFEDFEAWAAAHPPVID